MKPIGGYLELELRKGEHYHKDAICLNTARNCFEYVMRARNYRKVYFPYYTCEVMLEPIKKLGIDYDFYHINASLEPVELSVLEKDEAFLYTNYFGLKQNCVKLLAEAYGNQLVIDNAQAFYAEPIQGIDTFYSARKFFGVSDGAYLYTEAKFGQDFEQDVSFNRMSHLLKRIDLGAEFGFQDFRANDDSLCNSDIKLMSNLTQAVLSGVDYEEVKQKRRNNYSILDEAFGGSNLIEIEFEEESVPMVYPYLTNDESLRKKLLENKVFVAMYWPNVMEWCEPEDYERRIAQNMVCFPVDQRISEVELRKMIELVLSD